jgi:hypothetical protein
MKPPRALWTPFDLGRPFGAPNEPELQTQVLRAALELLERPDGPVVLEDFPHPAPQVEAIDEPGWSCPISFSSAPVDQSGLLPSALAEIEQLRPWHRLWVEARGRDAPGVSGLELPQILALLAQLADGDLAPEVSSELPLFEVIRLGLDDIRTWYYSAAQARPGRATHHRIGEWFWTETAAARLIAAAATALMSHPEPIYQTLADRGMVQRVYRKRLFDELAGTPGEDA